MHPLDSYEAYTTCARFQCDAARVEDRSFPLRVKRGACEGCVLAIYRHHRYVSGVEKYHVV